MKNKPLPALLLLLSFHACFSQDTLRLNINALNNGRIVLRYGDATLGNERAVLRVNADHWFIKINSREQAKVSLQSEGEARVYELNDFGKVYEVKNDTLLDNHFHFGNNITLKVKDQHDNTVATYTLAYKHGQDEDRATNKPDSNDIEHYKVGSIVRDALCLADATAGTALREKILAYYAGNVPSTQLGNFYRDNKFLDSLVNAILSHRLQENSLSLSSILSSIGGLDVTTIADGTAKFLVKRVKQELNIAFFVRLKKVIDSTKDISTLFPRTANLLDAIDDQVYEYERYLQNLREVFKQDITGLPRNLPGIVGNHRDFFSAHKDYKAALLSACYIANGLEGRAHPGDILEGYPAEYLDSFPANYKGAVQTGQLISASLRDTATGEHAPYWVTLQTLSHLVNNRLAFKFYLGLVYQQLRNRYNDIAYSGITLKQVLDTVAARYNSSYAMYTAYRNYVLRFGEKTEALNKMIRDYERPSTDSAAVELYTRYFRTSVDLVEYGTEAASLPVIKDHVPALHTLLRPYFDVAYSTADLAGDIVRRNYSSAINEVVHIYNLVTVKPGLTAKEVDLSKKTLRKLVQYGSFMATLATAKNSDEAAAAIETAALPVGSYRVKRENRWNISLNAYAGVYAGYEKIKGVDSSFTINSYGITAPIGVAFSYGGMKCKSDRGGKSITVFMSLIDLGAVTAFRFTNDSTEKLPTIALKDILAPGIQLSWGFGKVPLSLSAAYQYGPLLRKVNLDENKYYKHYHRFSLSLCVDIPLFNMFTRQKEED